MCQVIGNETYYTKITYTSCKCIFLQWGNCEREMIRLAQTEQEKEETLSEKVADDERCDY